jgi:phenylpropionate dioxygenase-like ring-hydroxylating dioxygenase large terminal subunit
VWAFGCLDVGVLSKGRHTFMMVTEVSLLRRFWYCVAPASSVTDRPFPFRILGEPLVLWRDEKGVVQAVQDRCLHRTAKLSLGHVEDGNIVCAYHGWAYNGTGACVKVPQDVKEAPRPFGVTAYRCAERYGYIWAALEDPIFEIPPIPEYGAEGYRQVPEFCEIWAANPLRIIENAFDAAHITFVHGSSFGESDPAIPPFTIEDGDDGFTLRNEIGVVVREHMKMALSISEASTKRVTENRFYLPFCRVGKIVYPNGLENIHCTFLTPVDDGRTQFIQWVMRNDTEHQVPADTVVAFDREVTLEDRAILEGTDLNVPLDRSEGRELHMHSDRPGLLMRKKLKSLLQLHARV